MPVRASRASFGTRQTYRGRIVLFVFGVFTTSWSLYSGFTIVSLTAGSADRRVDLDLDYQTNFTRRLGQSLESDSEPESAGPLPADRRRTHLESAGFRGAPQRPDKEVLLDTAALKCPPGAYLTLSERTERESQLRKYLAQRANGPDTFRPKQHRARPKQKLWVYESADWPKPKHCDGVMGHFMQTSNTPGTGGLFVVQQHRLVWGTVWKAGTTISEYLLRRTPPECASLKGVMYPMDALQYPERWRVAQHRHVLTVRHPVARFVSALQEVLTREVCRLCKQHAPSPAYVSDPDGDCSRKDDKAPDFNCSQGFRAVTDEERAHGPFLPTVAHIMAKEAIGARGPRYGRRLTRPNGENDIRSLLDSWLLEVECGTDTRDVQHGWTAASFLYPRQHVDVLLKLEDFARDIRDNVDVDPVCVEHINKTRVRTALKKPPWVPLSHDLLALLHSDSSLMRRLCHVYIQDFVCFKYDLPVACKHLLSG